MRLIRRRCFGGAALRLRRPASSSSSIRDTGAVVRWFDPVASFGRYDNEALRSLGLELSVLCQQIADAALAGAP